jgi:hypothetical protein
MRVFISWSGELSRELAEAIRKWLPSALQYVKPYFSPADIEKGSKWASEIFKELSASTVCIIVLTRDNLNSNWIMFEAGAISCTIDKARVCPLIFDIEETDLQGPLAQFQATKFLRQDVRQLFGTINGAAGENKLADSVVEAVFEKWWPDLEHEIQTIIKGHKETRSSKDIRSERDLIEELLLLTRKMAAEQEFAKAPAPLPVAIKYASSLYSNLMFTVRSAVTLGTFTIDGLNQLKGTLVELSAIVRQRTMAPTLKNGMLHDIADLVKVIEKKIEEDDEIPF